MAGSIKLFQFVQKYNQIIGIYSSQSTTMQGSINSTQAFFWISCAQIWFTIAAFLVFEANSMFDYGFEFFAFISIINGIAIYSIFIWQSQNTLKFIENCERFIEKRKYCFEQKFCEFIAIWLNLSGIFYRNSHSYNKIL